MSTVLCLITDEPETTSIIMLDGLEPLEYANIAAMAVRSALDRGAKLQDILEAVPGTTLNNHMSVPEPLVIV